MPAITALIEPIYSKRDSNGNCYWAFNYTDCETGKSINARISGGESNILATRFLLAKEGKGISHVGTKQLGIREFNKFVKGLPYAGCHPLTIAAFIRESLTGEQTRFVIKRHGQLEYPIHQIVARISQLGATDIQIEDELVTFRVTHQGVTNIVQTVGELVRYLDNQIELAS